MSINNIFKVILTPAKHRSELGLQVYYKDGNYLSPKSKTHAKFMFDSGYKPYDINLVNEEFIEKGEIFIEGREICIAGNAGEGLKLYATTQPGSDLPGLPYVFIRDYSRAMHRRVFVTDLNSSPIKLKPINYSHKEVKETVIAFAEYCDISKETLDEFILHGLW